MAEVRYQSGVPTAASFAGLGAPTQCAPLVVDVATGIIYSLTTGDVVVAAGALGTVTSVAQTFTGGLVSVAGSPITTSGTLALTVAGTSGGIPFFSSASTWASSAVLAANAIVLGGGAGSAPATTTTGTGVVTALGVNVGTSGSVVVNGGALGTPSSGTLSNATGLPISTGVSGLGTGIAAALAINTGSAGAPVLLNGALGTPSSGTGTNITGVNAAQLGGATFASPSAIGSGTPAAVTGTTLTASTGDVAATAGHHTIAADGKAYKGTYATGAIADTATATLTHPGGCAKLLLRESNTTGAWAEFNCSIDLAAMVKISSGGAGIAWTVTKDTAASVNVYQGAGGGGTGNVIIQNLTGSNKAFKACWLAAV